MSRGAWDRDVVQDYYTGPSCSSSSYERDPVTKFILQVVTLPIQLGCSVAGLDNIQQSIDAFCKCK